METADRSTGRFAGELRALKRRGCTILVVGPAAGMTRCGDLLGDDERARERFVVDTHHAPGSGDDPSVVRAGPGDVRSASAAPSAPGTTPSPETPDVDAVAGELIDRIDRVDAGGLEPGELRVCLGDLAALASDREALTGFVESVAERIRAARGMGHAHLPDTSPLRAAVEPLFEVTVEVRPVPEGRQQRWLLHDADLDSGWIGIEE